MRQPFSKYFWFWFWFSAIRPSDLPALFLFLLQIWRHVAFGLAPRNQARRFSAVKNGRPISYRKLF